MEHLYYLPILLTLIKSFIPVNLKSSTAEIIILFFQLKSNRLDNMYIAEENIIIQEQGTVEKFR